MPGGLRRSSRYRPPPRRPQEGHLFAGLVAQKRRILLAYQNAANPEEAALYRRQLDEITHGLAAEHAGR